MDNFQDDFEGFIPVLFWEIFIFEILEIMVQADNVNVKEKFN